MKMKKLKTKALPNKVHPTSKMKGGVFVNPNEVRSLNAFDAAQRAMDKEPRPSVANRGRTIVRKKK